MSAIGSVRLVRVLWEGLQEVLWKEATAWCASVQASVWESAGFVPVVCVVP